MKTLTKVLAVIMAALILALSCAVVIAEDDEREEPMRPPIVWSITGTHNGNSYSLDATNSSDSLLWASATYGASPNTFTLTLRYNPTFEYKLANGDPKTYYGNWTNLYHTRTNVRTITKSYTLNTAANYFYDEYGRQYSSFLPVGTYFVNCGYRLQVGSSTVCTLPITY